MGHEDICVRFMIHQRDERCNTARGVVIVVVIIVVIVRTEQSRGL